MRNRSTIFLFVLALTTSVLSAQNSIETPQSIDQLETNIDEDYSNYDTQLEHLEILAQKPLNINKASQQQLEATQLFSIQQTQALLLHIETFGELISIYELQTIPYFDLEFVKSILPFISINASIEDYHIKFAKLLSKGQSQLFFRYHQSFPNKQGQINQDYIGHPSQLYVRYKYNYDQQLSYGFTAEKDQGEPMFKSKNKLGFDFYSFHFFWRKNKTISALALGDYQVNLGQGLVVWTGFGFNKSIEVHLNKKEGNTLRPFTSLNEYLFLRGFATTINAKNWSFTPFVSYKKVDANISLQEDSSQIESNRIQVNGYHRTLQELENKHALKELKTGVNIQYKTRKWHLGYNALYSNYSQPLSYEKKPYNQYQFEGKNLFNNSLDYHLLLNKFHFFGEHALSFSKTQIAYATVNGMLFTPTKKIDFSIIHRYYQRNYQSNQYTNNFGESNTPNAENACFIGAKVRLPKRLSLSAYFDYYRIPWLKFRTKKPSNGYDISMQLRQKLSKKFEWYINFKREEKDGNTKIQLGTNDVYTINKTSRPYLKAYFGELGNEDVLRVSQTVTKQEIESATFITPILLERIRLHLMLKPHKNWTFQSRLEYSFYNDKINTPQHGYMIYQDIRFQSIKSPFGFSARIALFDISQFDSRIYAYESDVLYQFSIPALYNSGLRYYCNINYRITPWMQVWLRFASTYYSDIVAKGTGLDQVSSNKNYDIKMQIRWKF